MWAVEKNSVKYVMKNFHLMEYRHKISNKMFHRNHHMNQMVHHCHIQDAIGHTILLYLNVKIIIDTHFVLKQNIIEAIGNMFSLVSIPLSIAKLDNLITHMQIEQGKNKTYKNFEEWISLIILELIILIFYQNLNI